MCRTLIHHPNRFSHQGRNTATLLSRIFLSLFKLVLKYPLPANLSLLILNQAVTVRFNNYEYNKIVLFGNTSTVTVIVLIILFRKSKHCSFLYNFHRVFVRYLIVIHRNLKLLFMYSDMLSVVK